MIVGTAVCPHPPLLLRELTGASDVAADLRGTCESALSALVAQHPDVIVVVGGADTASGKASGSVPVAAYGGTGRAARTGQDTARRLPAERPLPLSLGVARRLLDAVAPDIAVEMVAVAWDASEAEIEDAARDIAGRTERVGLLVMGDGSARWGVRPPGHLVDPPVDVDATVRRALADADCPGLLAVDTGLAAELLFRGRAALQVMAVAVAEAGERYRSEVLYADAPFGVTYFVAVWSRASR